MVCSQYANAVGFLDEADALSHAFGHWSDTAAQCWATVGRQGRLLRLVLGETRMPMDCVILAGWRNAELTSWKAFGQ